MKGEPMQHPDVATVLAYKQLEQVQELKDTGIQNVMQLKDVLMLRKLVDGIKAVTSKDSLVELKREIMDAWRICKRAKLDILKATDDLKRAKGARDKGAAVQAAVRAKQFEKSVASASKAAAKVDTKAGAKTGGGKLGRGQQAGLLGTIIVTKAINRNMPPGNDT